MPPHLRLHALLVLLDADQLALDRGRRHQKYSLGGIVADGVKNTVWEGSWQTTSKIQFGRDCDRMRQKYNLGGIVAQGVKNTIWEGTWEMA